MPVVNVELSLDRARFEFDRHVGKWLIRVAIQTPPVWPGERNERS